MNKQRVTDMQATHSTGTPPPVPMPEHPQGPEQAASVPMPTAMPSPETSSTGPGAPAESEATAIPAMSDYPSGRGGMRMVPMGE
jgi:hypothetical protein